MKAKVVELSERRKNFPFLEAVLPLYHISRCVGFRFNFGGKIVSYIPDTGSCDNAVKLAEDADVLIAECAMKIGTGSDDWPHLNPLTAAEIAKKARAGKLALVHFDAEIYTTLKDRKIAQEQAKRIFKNVLAATDEREITA